jgi:hypothetical protein
MRGRYQSAETVCNVVPKLFILFAQRKGWRVQRSRSAACQTCVNRCVCRSLSPRLRDVSFGGGELGGGVLARGSIEFPTGVPWLVCRRSLGAIRPIRCEVEYLFFLEVLVQVLILGTVSPTVG